MIIFWERFLHYTKHFRENIEQNIRSPLKSHYVSDTKLSFANLYIDKFANCHLTIISQEIHEIIKFVEKWCHYPLQRNNRTRFCLVTDFTSSNLLNWLISFISIRQNTATNWLFHFKKVLQLPPSAVSNNYLATIEPS